MKTKMFFALLRANLLATMLIFCGYMTAHAQIVNIPDANFKNALVNTQCVDTNTDGFPDADADLNNDGQIQVSEAQAVQRLYVDSRSIADLTGIQSFSNLQYLDCHYNQLTSLNVQGLTNLQTLWCAYNQLPSLNVQGLTNLQDLNCSYNQLTSLDVQGLTNLQTLLCYYNQLTSLDVQGLTNLQNLSCYINQLTSINVQGCTNLQYLDCQYNQLTSLNVQGLTNLQTLWCNNNQLTSLNVQGLTNLQTLYCDINQLPSLNVQGCTNLQTLYCSYNQLPSLNVQGCTNLQTLYCPNNQLTNLNVQGLTNLQNLYCHINQLPSLNVQGLTNLQKLYCSANQLPSLNVQGLTNLQILSCSNNQLTSLNVQGLTNLQNLWCNNNPISCLSFLPQNLTGIYTDTTNITCLPNIPPNLETTLPLCQPNNPNGCLFSARLYGKAYQDLNGNCTADGNDLLQKNILIQARNTATQEIYTVNSKDDGFYELGLPAPATYEVKAIVTNNNYWQSCPPQTITLNVNTDQVQRDMFIKPLVPCADVEVNHQLSNIARPCSTAVYRANYFNAGTIAATGLTATVTLPNELTMQWATYPFTNMGNGVYQFSLPNINALERDTFSFSAFVNCTAQMGQMLCTEVKTTPNTYCTGGGLAGWDGSDIEVSGRCVGTDSIRFIIKNVGQGGMSTARNYGIIQDVVMVRSSTFQLGVGMSDSVTVAANTTSIYRIIADEAPNNPAGNTQETFMVWGCNGLNGMHWGFVNNFGLNNGASNPHQLCSEVRTSYDPNDISAVAEGVGAQHLILKDSDIEYKIRFQNTGNDTAFVVRLVNQLPNTLDPATLRIGTASHPFTWRLASNGVLEFLFQNIRLVDSTTNEPKSHGFVTYRIKTKPNLTNGTTINNQAGIYFDYNPVVMTNIYTHTIGETLQNVFVSVQNVYENNLKARIFPNPTSNILNIELDNSGNEQFDIKITNVLGQTMLSQKTFDNITILNVEHLPKGSYFISISNGEMYNIQKLIVQ